MAKKLKEEKCGECKYYKKGGVVAKCKRFPPPHPDTDYHNWCGEFKRK